MNEIKHLLVQLKPLRVGLLIIAIAFCIFAPAPGSPAIYQGIEVMTTLIIPALTPLVFMVLLLDALMNRVWMSDTEGEVRSRHKTVMVVDLIVTSLVFIVWIPYFIAIW